MNTIKLILTALLLTVLYTFITEAKADYPASIEWGHTGANNTWHGFATELAACQHLGSSLYYQANPKQNISVVPYIPNQSVECHSSPGGFFAYAARNYVCNGIPQPSATCAGNPPATCTDGKLAGSGTYSTTANPSNIGCIDGCSALFVGSAPQIDCGYGSGGIGTCFLTKTGRYVQTGETCNASSGDITPPTITPLNPDSPEKKCIAQGRTFGTVNGQVVCVERGTVGATAVPILPSAPNTKTTTNPDGSKSTTTITNTINNNGTVTTKTTITNINADGTPGTTNTTTSTQDQAGFCEQNPNLTICKERAASGGITCDNPPVCTGDAIDCLTQKQVYEHRCREEKLTEAITETDEAAAYEASKQTALPTDAEAEAALNKDGALDIDLGEKLQTELSNNKFNYGSGSCPQPIPVIVPALGINKIIPLDVFCQYARLIKFFIMFFAMMAALKIYTKVLGS